MEQQLKEYIEYKRGAWAPTTLRSEVSRLYAVLPLLHLTPQEVFVRLSKEGKKPYTIRTIFVRIADFRAHFQDYRFKEFLSKQANLFKNVYSKERVSITFQEARKRLEQIADKDVRELAFFILSNGLRSVEALTYKGDGMVLGKGARMRRIFNHVDMEVGTPVTYIKLYTELKKIGLKPHTLRKLAATELAANGLREADLMHVMGWTNIQTASWYLQPKSDEELANKLKEVLNP